MYRLSRQRMWCLHIVSTCQQAGGQYLAQVMRYIPTVCSHSGCACNAVMVFCTHECMYIWYMMTFSHTLQIKVGSPTGTTRSITIPTPHSQVKRYCYVYLLRVLHNLSCYNQLVLEIGLHTQQVSLEKV